MGPKMIPGVPFDRIVEEERATLGDIRSARPRTPKSTGKRKPVSLAFSGGGIRSATFNLGVVQALAKSGVLEDVEYISSVSGGGYINAWLTAWCARRPFADVLSGLKRAGGEDEAPQVRYLRKYSNYLTPRLGVLSADTWTLESTYSRNLILNMTIVIVSLAGAFLVPRAVLSLLGLSALLSGPVLLICSLILSMLAVSVVAYNFASLPDIRDFLRVNAFRDQAGVQIFVVVPVFLASLLMSVWIGAFPGEAAGAWPGAIPWGAAVYAGLWMFGWVVVVCLWSPEARVSRMKEMREEKVRSLNGIGGNPIVLLIAGALGGLLFSALTAWLQGLSVVVPPEVYYLVSPVALLGAFAAIVVFHIGLAGRGMTDDMREWWSRLGAWVTIYSILWIALWFTVFHLPGLLEQLLESRMISAGTLLAWLGSTITGVLLGKGAGTDGKIPGRTKEIAVKTAPAVFVVGFAALLSLAVERVLGTPPLGSGLYYIPVSAILLAVAYVIARRVDVNEFSMHAMYRNRLVRCYLGASRTSREPHPFTGLDPRDDLLMQDITRAKGRRPYDGPLPIFNTTLNVSSSERLDWQQRKARSFPFTPLGFGFREKNVAFSNAENDMPVKLGTVMATSGAAVSPNMGFHTSPAVAFLLTLFNVRLGQWFFNPARIEKGDRIPRLSLFYLYYELFGLTKESSRYVYLSDGGHFENLGLYELIRRECEYIVVSDASEDGRYLFGDLGGAIEKCRVDFGVEITDLKTEKVRLQGETGLSSAHWMQGKIHYRNKTGVIVYLKPSLTGDEPLDVSGYKATHGAFPHQSTGDQWFDEAQFEAYRALGYHIASELGR